VPVSFSTSFRWEQGDQAVGLLRTIIPALVGLVGDVLVEKPDQLP